MTTQKFKIGDDCYYVYLSNNFAKEEDFSSHQLLNLRILYCDFIKIKKSKVIDYWILSSFQYGRVTLEDGLVHPDNYGLYKTLQECIDFLIGNISILYHESKKIDELI